MADNEERKNSDDGSEPRSLREELQIEDLSCCLFFKDQKIFAAAGPGLPLMQMNADGTFVSLDPEQPYSSEIHEEVAARADEYGRLLNPLGELCKLTGMKYNGKPLFFVKEKQPENGQHLAAWFDDGMKPHYLHLGDTLLSGPMIIKIRDRMIMVDGELTNFPEISSD